MLMHFSKNLDSYTNNKIQYRGIEAAKNTKDGPATSHERGGSIVGFFSTKLMIYLFAMFEIPMFKE